jgi:PAS domain S-box-containing protein
VERAVRPVDNVSEITNEAFLAAIVESSDDAIVGKNLNGIILSWNGGAERIFGYSEAEAVGRPISLIIPEERIGEMYDILASIARGTNVERYETQRVTKDGRLIDVALTVSPIRNAQGKVIGASKNARDITRAKQSQRELERQALQLQTLYDASSTLGLTLDYSAIFKSMRGLVARLMDCDALMVSSYNPGDNLIRMTFAWVEGKVIDISEFPAIPLAPEGKGLQSSVLRTGEPLIVNDFEKAIKNTTTSYRVDSHGLVSSDLQPDKPQTQSILLVPIKLGSEVIGVVQIFSNRPNAYSHDDLTVLEGLVYQMAAASRNAELYQRVRESEAHFRLFANAMPQIAWSLNAEGKMDFLNERYREYSGLPADSDPDNSWVQVIHPDDRDSAMAAYRKCVESGEVWEQELRLRRKDGQYRWHLARLVPIWEEGRILRWFATSTDIHEKKGAEELARREGEALRASREELRLLNMELEKRVEERTSELIAANQEMEGFTYSVSHDLRAPLRSIMSSSMMLIEDYGAELPEEATAHLRRQAAAAKKLAALIDDLLQYSRIGRKTIDPHPVDLSMTVEAIADDISRRHPERKVDWRIEPGLHAKGDPNLLAMLLQNLIDNAFKFTAARDIAVIEFGRDEEGFYVRDNGVGFEMEYADKLFRPFERLHREADYAGTGIGLANVKRVVERHGGRVWVEGAPNKGATFRFTLG